MQLFLCLSTILVLRQAGERERERESNTSQLHHSATRWPGEEEHDGFRSIKGIIPKSGFCFVFFVGLPPSACLVSISKLLPTSLAEIHREDNPWPRNQLIMEMWDFSVLTCCWESPKHNRGNKTTKHHANKHFTSMESESPSELVDGLLAVNPCV